MASSVTGQHIGPFLLGCVCVLVAAIVVWALWTGVTPKDQLRLTLLDTTDLRTVAEVSETTNVAGTQAYSVCVCPSCGTTVTQAGQVNCTNVLCPVCGTPMVRPRSVFAWRELVFRPISIGSLIAVILAAVAHYLIWGPKRLNHAGIITVKRFSTFETAAHFVVMFSFLISAITGMAGIIGPGANISSSLGGDFFLILHYVAAAGFTVGLVTIWVLWFRDCLLNKDDVEWIRHGGGYFGYRGELPAGRFNPGQKVFLWLVGVLGIAMIVTGLMRLFPVFSRITQQTAYMVHDVVALMLILAVLVHTYLGTVANPGSWQGVFSGWVTEEWAKAHHPNWDYQRETPNPQRDADMVGEAVTSQEGL